MSFSDVGALQEEETTAEVEELMDLALIRNLCHHVLEDDGNDGLCSVLTRIQQVLPHLQRQRDISEYLEASMLYILLQILQQHGTLPNVMNESSLLLDLCFAPDTAKRLQEWKAQDLANLFFILKKSCPRRRSTNRFKQGTTTKLDTKTQSAVTVKFVAILTRMACAVSTGDWTTVVKQVRIWIGVGSPFFGTDVTAGLALGGLDILDSCEQDAVPMVNNVQVTGLTPRRIYNLLQVTGVTDWSLVNACAPLPRLHLLTCLSQVLLKYAQSHEEVDFWDASRVCHGLIRGAFTHTIAFLLDQLKQQDQGTTASPTSSTTSKKCKRDTTESSSSDEPPIDSPSRMDLVRDPAYPFLVNIDVKLANNNLKASVQIANLMEKCTAISSNNKKQAWWHVMDYLRFAGIVFLDGNNVGSSVYQQKRNLFLELRRYTGNLGFNCMVDWYRNLIELVEKKDEVLLTPEEANYLTLASQQTIFKLILDKCHLNGVNAAARFRREFPNLYLGMTKEDVLTFAMKANPIPKSLLDEGGALDLNDFWVRRPAEEEVATPVEVAAAAPVEPAAPVESVAPVEPPVETSVSEQEEETAVPVEEEVVVEEAVAEEPAREQPCVEELSDSDEEEEQPVLPELQQPHVEEVLDTDEEEQPPAQQGQPHVEELLDSDEEEEERSVEEILSSDDDEEERSVDESYDSSDDGMMQLPGYVPIGQQQEEAGNEPVADLLGSTSAKEEEAGGDGGEQESVASEDYEGPVARAAREDEEMPDEDEVAATFGSIQRQVESSLPAVRETEHVVDHVPPVEDARAGDDMSAAFAAPETGQYLSEAADTEDVRPPDEPMETIAHEESAVVAKDVKKKSGNETDVGYMGDIEEKPSSTAAAPATAAANSMQAPGYEADVEEMTLPRNDESHDESHSAKPSPPTARAMPTGLNMKDSPAEDGSIVAHANTNEGSVSGYSAAGSIKKRSSSLDINEKVVAQQEEVETAHVETGEDETANVGTAEEAKADDVGATKEAETVTVETTTEETETVDVGTAEIAEEGKAADVEATAANVEATEEVKAAHVETVQDSMAVDVEATKETEAVVLETAQEAMAVDVETIATAEEAKAADVEAAKEGQADTEEVKAAHVESVEETNAVDLENTEETKAIEEGANAVHVETVEEAKETAVDAEDTQEMASPDTHGEEEVTATDENKAWSPSKAPEAAQLDDQNAGVEEAATSVNLAEAENESPRATAPSQPSPTQPEETVEEEPSSPPRTDRRTSDVFDSPARARSEDSEELPSIDVEAESEAPSETAHPPSPTGDVAEEEPSSPPRPDRQTSDVLDSPTSHTRSNDVGRPPSPTGPEESDVSTEDEPPSTLSRASRRPQPMIGSPARAHTRSHDSHITTESTLPRKRRGRDEEEDQTTSSVAASSSATRKSARARRSTKEDIYDYDAVNSRASTKKSRPASRKSKRKAESGDRDSPVGLAVPDGDDGGSVSSMEWSVSSKRPRRRTTRAAALSTIPESLGDGESAKTSSSQTAKPKASPKKRTTRSAKAKGSASSTGSTSSRSSRYSLRSRK